MTSGGRVRQPVEACEFTRLSGLEVLNMDSTVGFVNIGERCNIAGMCGGDIIAIVFLNLYLT